MVDAAWKDVVGQGAAAPVQPRKQASAGILQQLELHGLARFRLDDDGAGANLFTEHQVADLDLDDVAAAQLAIDCGLSVAGISLGPRATERVKGAKADRGEVTFAFAKGAWDVNHAGGAPSMVLEGRSVVSLST